MISSTTRCRAFSALVVLSLTVGLFAAPALALEPDQIVLIVNKNEPIGVRLAAHYAAVRHIPDGHTITLDLPDTDEIDFLRYEQFVVPPVRQFLIDHGLKDQVTCLVTFYGVPFRIASRVATPENTAEVSGLRQELSRVLTALEPVVGDMESLATSLDPTFRPGTGTTLTGLAARAGAALGRIGPLLGKIPDPAQRQADVVRLLKDLEALGGPAAMYQRLGMNQLRDPNTPDDRRQAWIALRDRLLKANADLQTLGGQRYDPDARAQILQIAKENLGLVGYGQIIGAEIDYLSTDPIDPNAPNSQVTAAALDNELALLWWGMYPRRMYMPNPLNFHFGHPHTLPVMMVMRLDGPSEQVVTNLIDASFAVEQKGLSGTIAIDAGAFPDHQDAPGKPDPYRTFDHHLEHLFVIVKRKGNLPVRYDDDPLVFPPHSVKNVALYCGWYSLRHYIPGCDFVPGGVGYHVASLEMVGLHGDDPGWVNGLMKDGVVGTLGAVAEPYLPSFPLPDEFFPLLMTGKLTLAEVYWRTTPMVSWMISCIGDPLYNPFAAHPAIAAADLPDDLQPALAESPATQPTTAPVTPPMDQLVPARGAATQP